MSNIKQLLDSYCVQYRGGWRPKNNKAVKRVFRMVCLDADAARLREFNSGKIDVVHHVNNA